jgi:hypothetical protein
LRSELNIIDYCNVAWCHAHTLFELARRKQLRKYYVTLSKSNL